MLFLLLIVISVYINEITAHTDANLNLTEFLHNRRARSLIFQGGGTIKFVIGPTLPVNLGDPITWRSLICSYNLHGGHYAIPTTPLYPWDKWEDTFARSLKTMRHSFDEYGKYEEDESRLFLYTALETYMDKESGGNGRICLLRSICENAQISQHIGVYGEVVNVILTPGKEKLDPAYRNAYEAGRHGVDCLKLYNKCPRDANILDKYLFDF